MATEGVRESSFCDENQNINIVRALHDQKRSSTFCDVIMKVCGRDIYAHSNILAAASPYFNTFLSQDLPRQFSQRAPQIIEIQIDGSEPNMLYEEAVATVIDFIYTGMLTVQESNVAQVSEIARIMQIDSVVKHCEDFVSGKLDGENGGVLVKRKEGVDASTNTERSLLVDLMTTRQGGRPGAGDFRSKPPHGKFLSLVSVSTQVAPRLLGLRDSEKEMVDKGVCTDQRGESVTSVILPKASDSTSSVVHVVEVQVEKPRTRGRKKNQWRFLKEKPTEHGHISKSDPVFSESKSTNVEAAADETQESHSTPVVQTEQIIPDKGENGQRPNDAVGNEVKMVSDCDALSSKQNTKLQKDEKNACNVSIPSPRRSLRRAKPKVFDSDFEQSDLTLKKLKARRGLFRSTEKGADKPTVMYAGKEAPIITSGGVKSKTVETKNTDEDQVIIFLYSVTMFS